MVMLKKVNHTVRVYLIQKADKLTEEGASVPSAKRYAQDKANRGDVGDGGKGQEAINVKTGVTDKDPKKRAFKMTGPLNIRKA